ncbi:MAG: hypothetical protein ABSH27_04295 [Solirubrobacteraceae bacterium]
MSAELPTPLPEPVELSALERRYRRLLALYPAAWRARHDDEVLAVLLECAPPGRARPSWRDACDLVAHALMERLRGVGRSPTSEDARSGVALAAIVALAVLAALSLQQLVVIAPNAGSWGLGTGYVGRPALIAMLASAGCLTACVCWLAGRRRLACAAIAFTDAGFLVASLMLRHGSYNVSWSLIVAILGLAAVASLLMAHRAVSEAGRELIGRRGFVELIGALLLVAEIGGWRHVAWAGSVYGSQSDNGMPAALAVAYLAAAVVALVMAVRNPVPLIAVTVLSPLLLASGFVSITQGWLFGNADVSVALLDDAIPLGAVAFLVLASLAALRRSRSRALG